jgi:hypothetical protein
MVGDFVLLGERKKRLPLRAAFVSKAIENVYQSFIALLIDVSDVGIGQI